MTLRDLITGYHNDLGTRIPSHEYGWALFFMVDFFFMVTRHLTNSAHELTIEDFNQENVDRCFAVAERYMDSNKLRNLGIALNDFRDFLIQLQFPGFYQHVFDDPEGTFVYSVHDIKFPFSERNLDLSKLDYDKRK